jgi:hypothetical protein
VLGRRARPRGRCATSGLEIAAAIGFAVLAIVLMVPLAARIYRGGVLRTRGRVSFREA